MSRQSVRSPIVSLLRWAFCLFSIGAVPAFSEDRAALSDFISTYCSDCHNETDRIGDLSLEFTIDAELHPSEMLKRRPQWESVWRKLTARQMPPLDADRPTEAEYRKTTEALAERLDQVARIDASVPPTDTFRRLTRVEYQNSIRDLLSLNVDASKLLPRDESSHGFDNITVGELSPALLTRYLSAAEKISRLAIGTNDDVRVDVFRVPPDVTQERHLEGLPLGTRGGVLIPYNFSHDGEYEFEVRLARDRNEEVEGLRRAHTLEILVDRARAAQFTVKPPPKGNRDYSQVDAHCSTRIPISAGPHQIGVTFVGDSSSLIETKRQPYQARFNMHRHPRTAPAVFQVSITGPFDATGRGTTPSRKQIFVSYPKSHDEEESVARTILTNLTRRAWRRPVRPDDVDRFLEFYRRGRRERDFELGIQKALTALLVSPRFLFRIEVDPPDAKSGTSYRLSDIEIASRLSYFLWSSIPDDELLQLAENDQLSRPGEIERQCRRMLADPKATALSTNFADQWLYLRNLDAAHPDMRKFPDFDDNLRQAMKRESQRLFQSIVDDDSSVLQLLDVRHSYLNERLARHYGIPHVIGSRTRRITLPPGTRRGGILRHGSVLTVTSYATRTSPVIRGHWVLKNLIGSPPPPPPPNVPALEDNTVAANLTVRERLAEHRANPNCAQCHEQMDPIGFAFENYDAIGRWRTLENELPVDATGRGLDGTEFHGIDGLERELLKRPELFVGTLVEKLMTYALGRGIEYRDAAKIRKIVRQAKNDDYRFSSLILGIVTSEPFQMRTVR